MRINNLTRCYLVLGMITFYGCFEGVSQPVDTHSVNRLVRGFGFLSPGSNDFIRVPQKSIILNPYYYFKRPSLNFFGTSGTKYTLVPNTNQYLGFYTGFKGLGVALSLKMPASANRVDVAGETHYTGLGVNYINRFLFVEIKYEKYTGFSDYYSKQTLGNMVQIRPDIRYYNLGFSSMFSFSDHYSLSAAFNAREIQMKSAFSFVVALQENIFSLKTDSVIIAPVKTQFYTENRLLRSATFNTIGLLPGIGYTHVYKDWFAGVVVNTGPVLQSGLVRNFDGSLHSRFSVPWVAGFKISLGYNLTNWFANLVIDNSYMPYKNNDEKFSLRKTVVTLNTGFRI